MSRKFDVSVTVDHTTGDVMAVYLEFRRGKSAETREYCDGAAFADYDRSGQLLGIELLAPCKLSVLNRIDGAEPAVREFVKRAAPRAMVTA